MRSGRREFLQQVAAAGAAAQTRPEQAAAGATARQSAQGKPGASRVAYPRVFRGRQLAMIAFPLGGVGAGSVSLGGRGQLRDWEIFNRPDKGNSLSYAFPSIWVQAGKGQPVARVLEARILPPYEGQDGLGSRNAPGLTRLAHASFSGEFPFARVEFDDASLPVKVRLDAFSPLIPNEPDDSGIPAAILRYTVENPGSVPATASIAYSIDNPVGTGRQGGAAEARRGDTRVNELRDGHGGLIGLHMTNPALPAEDPMQGSFALAVVGVRGAKTTVLPGWPEGRWWNSPMLFWDDFSSDGMLGPEPEAMNRVGAVCMQQTIAPGKSATYTFVIAWRFPNRTPERCGWHAEKGYEKALIGNWYAERFPDAWRAAEYLVSNMDRLESKSRAFTKAVRESSVPDSVKDAAMANLSTLVSTTCFRTADGEFHGFEGVNNRSGCCHGNCTHVWNYETTTTFLFPSFARSLRKAAFGYSMDDAGAIHFRQALPEGTGRSGFAAADGQMGQILHTYLDWQLSGDTAWLRNLWPRVKKALEFAWVPGGWDADRDGVLEGVQHNTYDVEFYGPNPECGIYYLGALRAGEEMARAVGDETAAATYRRLFERGSDWIDANLFNGEYYIQQVRGYQKDQIAPALRSDMGSENTTDPQYQLGAGCLADQLIGQYLADTAGLGPLLKPANIRKTLESIMRYNYRQTLERHDSVQRTYALNDESAVLVCDYGKARRPRIPFPYYAEAWTGIEYLVGTQLIYGGMVRDGVRVFESARLRHDGEKRNPWNEPECGHHYARAMSAWSGFAAMSGFLYRGADGAVVLTPRWGSGAGRCFWSTATGWGTYARTPAAGGSQRIAIDVLHGSLPCRSIEVEGSRVAALTAAGRAIPHASESKTGRVAARLRNPLALRPGTSLVMEVAS